MRKFAIRLELKGSKAMACMNDIAMSCPDADPQTVPAVMYLQEELHGVGDTLNEVKTVALPPMRHTPILRETALLAEVRLSIIE